MEWSLNSPFSGTGFTTFELPAPLRTVSLGICMDLNPQIPEWTSAAGPYEIADYCIEKKSNLLLLLNAWLDSGEQLEDDTDWHTLNYWAARTRPLWNDQGSGKVEITQESVGHETMVIVCNRSGGENSEF